MIALTASAFFLVFCVALYTFCRKSRRPRVEDGHDRAERRERDWYR
jgi:hypothetical protein